MGRAFGGTPTYLHAADRRWVMRSDQAIDRDDKAVVRRFTNRYVQVIKGQAE